MKTNKTQTNSEFEDDAEYVEHEMLNDNGESVTIRIQKKDVGFLEKRNKEVQAEMKKMQNEGQRHLTRIENLEALTAKQEESSDTPFQRADRERLINNLRRQFKGNTRKIFRYCFLGEMTTKEAAKKLRLSPKTVYNLRNRIWKRLHEIKAKQKEARKKKTNK